MSGAEYVVGLLLFFAGWFGGMSLYDAPLWVRIVVPQVVIWGYYLLWLTVLR